MNNRNSKDNKSDPSLLVEEEEEEEEKFNKMIEFSGKKFKLGILREVAKVRLG